MMTQSVIRGDRRWVTVLENRYDHLRDLTHNGGYINYGTQLTEFEPTYMQVWGWD